MARETWVQSQVESYQRLKKWYLMPFCLTLSIIRYRSRVKWSNPGKGVAPSPTPWCSKLSKREPSGHPRLRSPTLLLLIYIFIYIYMCVCVWERERDRERERASIYIYIYVCVCVRERVHTYIYIYMCVCVCEFIYIYIYIYIYIAKHRELYILAMKQSLNFLFMAISGLATIRQFFFNADASFQACGILFQSLDLRFEILKNVYFRAQWSHVCILFYLLALFNFSYFKFMFFLDEINQQIQDS